MKHAFLACIALAGTLAACSGIENLGANKIAKSVKSGGEIELAHWAYWDNNCQGEPFDTNIISAPKNGKTELRDAVFAFPSKNSSGATTGCVDKIIESTKVFYIPNKGYKGPEEVVVEFSGSSGTVRNAYAITVR